MELKYIGDIYYCGQKAPWGKGVVAGNTVYLSGVDGIDPKTGEFPKEVETQTDLALEKAKERLNEVGSNTDHIVRFVSYVVGRENIDGYRKSKDMWFRRNYNLPSPIYASTLIVVAGLARPEMIVEFDITAVVK